MTERFLATLVGLYMLASQILMTIYVVKHW